jgi:hypothetical protein
LADSGNIFKIQAVSTNHTHRRNLESVNRVGNAFHSAGNGLAVSVGEKGRDFPIVEERDRSGVQAGLAFSVVAVVPRTEFEASAMMACAEYQDVALTEVHTLSLFAFFQFGGTDSFARFQPLDGAQTRYIEQNSTADDAMGIGGDVLEIRPGR